MTRITATARIFLAGFFLAVTGCPADFSYDFSDAGQVADALCGNQVAEPGEACDGTDFGVQDCVSQGFYGGTLLCQTDCQTFSATDCHGECGDGILNGPEACDGSDFGGGSCLTMGYAGGLLTCMNECGIADDGHCTHAPALLITELGKESGLNALEALNQSTGPVQLDGWKLVWWSRDTAGFPVEGTLVLPELLLLPGERVVMRSTMDPTPIPPVVEGLRIQFYQRIEWDLDDLSGAAALLTPNDLAVDFVTWGPSGFLPPASTSWTDDPNPLPLIISIRTLGRVPDGLDTDRAADFCWTTETMGLPNSDCQWL